MISWRSKKSHLDAQAGLIFDWRHEGYFPWRFILFCIIVAVVIIGLISQIHVMIPPILVNEKTYVDVLYLNHSDAMRVMKKNGIVPMSQRIPVWADPLTKTAIRTEIMPDISLQEQENTATPESLHTITPPQVHGEMSTYLRDFPLKSISIDLDDSVVEEVKFTPLVLHYEGNLEGYEQTSPPQSVSCCGGVLQTIVWVRVNAWGQPENVTIAESADDPATDEAAIKFVKSLSWAPQGGAVRSGVIVVGWKEVSL